VLIAVFVTVIQWFLGALMFYPLFFAFGLQDKLPFASIFAVLASAAVGVSIPTPGYARSISISYPNRLQLCNSSISDSAAKVFALVTHAANFFPVIVIGIILAFREGISLTHIERTSEELKSLLPPLRRGSDGGFFHSLIVSCDRRSGRFSLPAPAARYSLRSWQR